MVALSASFAVALKAHWMVAQLANQLAEVLDAS
jgi:hypothetical protein